jgi:hypothetical protein
MRKRNIKNKHIFSHSQELQEKGKQQETRPPIRSEMWERKSGSGNPSTDLAAEEDALHVDGNRPARVSHGGRLPEPSTKILLRPAPSTTSGSLSLSLSPPFSLFSCWLASPKALGVYRACINNKLPTDGGQLTAGGDPDGATRLK